jgi:hypothetical protein
MTLRIPLQATGSTSIDLREQFGPRVELQGFSFGEPPIEFRFCRRGHPICDWRRGDSEYHDLQRGSLTTWHERGTGFAYTDPAQDTDHVTFGLSPDGLTLETRGLLGAPSVLIDLRPGSYPESGTCGGN